MEHFFVPQLFLIDVEFNKIKFNLYGRNDIIDKKEESGET